MKAVKIKDVFIYPFLEMDELVEFCGQNKKMYISLNAEIIMKAKDDVVNIINENIGYADGYGAVKALQAKGIKNVSRIPGCELWLQLIKKYQKEHSFYLIGATEDTINGTVKKLKQMYPEINIVGYRNGFIKTKEERATVIDDVTIKKPDFVFVAMGFPIQERLMNEMAKRHPAVYLNLGGSFDVFTGKVSRAPKLIQNIGMEWLYRFITHPSRYKRQIVYLQFMWAYLTRKL